MIKVENKLEYYQALVDKKKEDNMTTQLEHAELLTKLHMKGNPLIIFNIWDAGSAKTLEGIGAKVIATGSWSVAAAHGCEDGEKLSFTLAIDNLKRIVESVNLPVTIDIEGGYGQSPNEVLETVTKVIEVGAVGINIEDQIVGEDELYSIEEQCVRIKAARQAADHASIPIFINARTDVFLKVDPSEQTNRHLEEAINRASAYAKAGANGFFVPGMWDLNHINKICEFSPIPVNIMITSHTPSPKQLAEIGVARISYGPGPYIQVMDTLKEAGHKALLLS